MLLLAAMPLVACGRFTIRQHALDMGMSSGKASHGPEWLCLTAEEANSSVSMTVYDNPPPVSLEYSTDGKTWSDFIVDDTVVTLANVGDKMYLRANLPNTTFATDYGMSCNAFVMTGKIAASGNIMTLLSKDTSTMPTMGEYCFSYLFYGLPSLTSCPELPATELSNGCYMGMFCECSSLIHPPELPATVMATECYSSLFSDCSSLVEAPELPATTLAPSCYIGMFGNCSSLVVPPELPATTLASSCYYGMFSHCTSLVTAPELPATTMTPQCYTRMFEYCSSLTSAPELPATTLVSSCYSYMFSHCTSLVEGPYLPATTLVSSCYSYMFDGCEKLSGVKVEFLKWTAGTSSTLATTGWMRGVLDASTCVFDKPESLTVSSRGANYIPSKWSVVSH